MLPKSNRPQLPISLLIVQRATAIALLLAIPLACKGDGSNGRASTSLDPPVTPDPPGDVPGFPFVDHIDQVDITEGRIRFDELFILGDELFEAQYNALDGAGIQQLPDGTPFPERFARVPPGGGRSGGPNAQACNACHNLPFGTAAGEAASNVAQDPAGTGNPPFNTRNPPSLFGSAVLQRLAEEITDDLLAIREDAAAATTPGGASVTADLISKGISYGTIIATQNVGGTVTFDLSRIEGIGEDLVVRPYGWKGDTTTLRDFTRRAAALELGMEPDELVEKDALQRTDPDGDGVEGEFTIGDITALTIYIGAQEIPTTLEFLAREGLQGPPPPEQANAIARGEVLFSQIGCAECHVPELPLGDPVFEEPTLRGGGNYFDGDIDPVATALRTDRPFEFNLVQEGDFPRLAPGPGGRTRVALFGDLKRHNMGTGLADSQPTPVKSANGQTLELAGTPVTVSESVFLTAELWGAGNTGPWLHDGRASTLNEAVLLHGVDAPPPVGDPARSDAQGSRGAFAALSDDDRAAVVAFLKSLVHFEIPEEE